MYDDDYGTFRPFDATGRVGRLRYLVYTFGISILLNIIVLIAAFIPLLGIVIMIVACIAMIAIYFYLTIQRCHDFNMTGWLSLISLIPLVAIVFLFIPGTKGENDYGYQPPPNTTLINVVAIALIGISILFFVAGIFMSEEVLMQLQMQ